MVTPDDLAPVPLARAFAVAAAYELGRAVALVAGATHRQRRSSEPLA